MANLDAKNYVLKTAVPSQKIPAGEQRGALFLAYDEITFPAAVVAVNDVIRTAIVVPAGAIIKECGVVAPSLGTTGIFSLGKTGAVSSLVLAADAGGQAVKASADAAATDLLVKLTADTEYFLTCTEATDVAATKKLKVWVEYSFIGG